MAMSKLATNPTDTEDNMNNQISQAMALIKNEHMINLDRRNVKSWENRISIILDNFIDEPSFLCPEGPTPSSNEKICCGILIYSLPEEIQSKENTYNCERLSMIPLGNYTML
ncbi:hypothetical protein O181_058354 [Austropuccinia psidii MF-1]|uniref:Uncharacterized protein n=1 Tax=Austropuccinia psidii MF-1 TaxID=1389203 RepID=A0A9Q3EC58_9BASI|nr:hypothetical protein [Austropuccinia psidii MF-1]